MGRVFQLQSNISRNLFVLIALLLLVVNMAQAVTATPEQIEQFKQLPRAEQERIAQRLGIDITEFQQPQTNGSSATLSEPLSNNQRGTMGDYKSTQNSPRDNSNSSALEGEGEDAGVVEQRSLRPYGYDLFDNNAEAFMPNVDVPIPNNYIVGPGDSVVVQLYGKENDSYNFTVNREGMVHFPKIGPVALAGLSFNDVQTLINKTVQEQMIGVKSSVTMGAIRSIRVFVLGEAVQPGSYVVSSLSTMTNALFSSGGITKIGSLRNVQLKRNGVVITTLDLYDLLLKGDTSNDSRLLSGDVIFIPPIGKTVSVDGEVRRPAIYELKQEKTVEQVIQLAGGFLPTAYPSESRIQRIDDQGDRTVVDVNLAATADKRKAVRPADTIIVPSVLDSLENIVTIEGHVKRPGIVAWKPGLRISDVLGSINNLLSNPDLRVGLIEREIKPTRKLTAVLFDPASALINPKSSDDLPLEPRDTIRIFNLTDDRSELLSELIESLQHQADELRKEPLVKISGNVRFPGTYPLTANMSVDNLIYLAGGLTNDAYSLAAEITRYQLDANQRQLISHVTVDLKDSEQQRLERQDNLHIKRLPDWSAEQTVTLTGEVMFPGTYTIQRGETLSQIVNRAGGLTDQAYPEGAVFTREELQKLEAERIKQLRTQLESDIVASNIEQQSKETQVDMEDAQALLKSISTIKPLGRLVIDLPNIMENPDTQDVFLEGGDSILIPKFKQSVTVVGEVQFPTSHFYSKKLDVGAYIERSGGTNLKADKNRIYIVKANGRVVLPNSSNWFSRSNTDIAPGDTVVVPLDADRIKSLTLWTNVSEIFYQIALGAAAVASF